MKFRNVRVQFLALIAVMCLTFAAGSPLVFASDLAVPIKSTVIVDGESVSFDAYNIRGENFFKLRDLAYAVRNSEKKFSVGYDAANDSIAVTSGEEYLPVGGELVKKGGGNKTPSPVSSAIFKGGRQYYLSSYKIDGSNFFKLRDVATIFDIGVGWDGAKNTITLATDQHYTMPSASGTAPYLNTYYLMAVGMTLDEANARYGTGTLGENADSVVQYPQGFFVAPILNGETSMSGDAVCSGMEGKLPLLIQNCPQTITFSELSRIFGTAYIGHHDDGTCYVVVPYAGYQITMDSDSKGNVPSTARFNFNPANGPYTQSSGYNYEGTWSEGVFGEYSCDRNYNELTLRNISKTSLEFDLFMSRGIIDKVENITATSTDGTIYTANYEGYAPITLEWAPVNCSIKITLKDGRVFMDGNTGVGDYSGELSRGSLVSNR